MGRRRLYKSPSPSKEVILIGPLSIKGIDRNDFHLQFHFSSFI
jgi:hypothetical protein